MHSEVDEKGQHCIICIITKKRKCKIWYLNWDQMKIEKIFSFHKEADHIDSMQLYVPQLDNIDGRKFEVICATKSGNIHHGSYFIDDKGKFEILKHMQFMVSFSPKESMTSVKVITSIDYIGVVGVTSTRMH